MLNNTDVSCEYILKLKQSLDEIVQNNPPVDAKDQEKLKLCLTEFNNISKNMKEKLLMVWNAALQL